MKRMSILFPITCILLLVAGATGLVMDFLIAVEKMKDPDCPKFLAILIILAGLIWALAAIVTAIRSYKEAKRLIQLQRKQRSGKVPKGRLTGRQIGTGAILIIAVCVVQIIFALLTGLKSWQVLYFIVAGMVIPYLFMISGKAVSA